MLASTLVSGKSGKRNLESPTEIEPPQYLCPPVECPDGFKQKHEDCQCTELAMCTMDICWDGSSRNEFDCSCPPENEVCPDVLCPDGSMQNPEDCQCTEYAICTEDLCWDGSSRNEFDCSCPPMSECWFTCEPGYVYDSIFHSCRRDTCGGMKCTDR